MFHPRMGKPSTSGGSLLRIEVSSTRMCKVSLGPNSHDVLLGDELDGALDLRFVSAVRVAFWSHVEAVGIGAAGWLRW